MQHNKNYLTPKEVAKMLMVSTSAIRLWATKGILKTFLTAGGHRRFRIEDVKQFAEQRALEPNIPAEKTLKVLIIDDEPMFAEYLQALLLSEDDSISTKVCVDAFEAGISLKDFLPDVVLLDLMMPGVDGFKVCTQIKQNPIHEHVRVIAISGDLTTENRQKIINNGAEACLEKPVNTSNLMKLLREH